MSATTTATTTTEAGTKKFPCPVHGTVHEATMYVFPHKYAGIWECDETGESDSCAHNATHKEHHEELPTHIDQQFVHAHDIEVCNCCGVMVNCD